MKYQCSICGKLHPECDHFFRLNQGLTMKPGDVIQPVKGDFSFPGPIIVNAVYDNISMTETTDQFNTLRDYKNMHQRTGAGEGITIGVGDTGVDKTHMQGDLKGTIPRDFTRSRNSYYDIHGHGSHVTGHIGARGDGDGFIGLAPKCNLMHAKVLGDSGSGSSTGIAQGIRWLVDGGCKIVSLSLGGGFSQESEDACRYAVEKGTLVFAAMGNSGNRGGGHPGTSRYTFGITAVDYNLRIAGFSSRDNAAKYAGYGVNVLSLLTNGKLGRLSGTSMACPDQAGLCGNILSYMNKLNLPLPNTMEEYETIVRSAIQDLGSPGWDKMYGDGFIHLDKVLDYLDSVAEPQPPTDPPTDPPPEEGEPTVSWGAVNTNDGIKLITPYGTKNVSIIYNNKTYKGKISE